MQLTWKNLSRDLEVAEVAPGFSVSVRRVRGWRKKQIAKPWHAEMFGNKWACRGEAWATSEEAERAVEIEIDRLVPELLKTCFPEPAPGTGSVIYKTNLYRGETCLASETWGDPASVLDDLEELARHAEDADEYKFYRLEIIARPAGIPDNYCDDPGCLTCTAPYSSGHIY